MERQPLAGSRIRERRLDLGVRQADLASDVGISASYLNLIEHNKRRIGGKLLADLARILKVDAAVLRQGADTALLDQMRHAAAKQDGVEIDRAEDIATRYPGWSRLIAGQAARIDHLETQVNALRDRMSHDPQLAEALHALISAVTSIRSTASILISDDRLDADWRRRFHINIHDDSLKLADQSETVMALLQQNDVAETIDDSPHPASDTYLAEHQINETSMPDFTKAARENNYDPSALSHVLNVDISTILHRLAALPPGDGHPPMGLAVCDASGATLHFKATPGFALPRDGAGCPLWPLYSVLSTPHAAIKTDVVLPDAAATRMRCFAVSYNIAPPAFNGTPVIRAIMLVMPDPDEGPTDPLPVGTSCRICPRTACIARREPSILGKAQKSM